MCKLNIYQGVRLNSKLQSDIMTSDKISQSVSISNNVI